jgi:hypothetical protein
MNKGTLGHAATEPWKTLQPGPRPLLIIRRSPRLNCEIIVPDHSYIE